MKMKTQRLKLTALTLFIGLSIGFVLLTAMDSPKTKSVGAGIKTLTHYTHITVLNTEIDGGDCGTNRIVVVASATDEVETGTHLYSNLAMTVDLPSCILTATDGPYSGHTFSVGSGGIVGAEKTPPVCR